MIMKNAYNLFELHMPAYHVAKLQWAPKKISMPRQASQCQVVKLPKQDPALAIAHILQN